MIAPGYRPTVLAPRRTPGQISCLRRNSRLWTSPPWSGGPRSARRPVEPERRDRLLDPDPGGRRKAVEKLENAQSPGVPLPGGRARSGLQVDGHRLARLDGHFRGGGCLGGEDGRDGRVLGRLLLGVVRVVS